MNHIAKRWSLYRSNNTISRHIPPVAVSSYATKNTIQRSNSKSVSSHSSKGSEATTIPNRFASEDKIPLAAFLCDNQPRDATALRYITIDTKTNSTGTKVPLNKVEYTFGDMKEYSSKFATFLRNAGVKKGDRVAVMLPKCPELMISGLGIWRCGAIYVPLFTAFGPEAISHRINDSEAKVIITDDVNRVKLEKIPEIINDPNIKIITVNSKGDKRDFDFWKDGIRSNVLADDTIELMSANDCLILLYTSGTTGKPKGVIVRSKAIDAFETYMKVGLYVEDEKTSPLRFWNLADPGWAYGLYYGVIGPLLTGTRTTFVNAPFKPATVYSVLEAEQINNFTAAPTAYRAMMAEGNDLAKQFNFCVQRASSAGEPLNPEAIRFFQNLWGVRIHDHYGQTECGMIVCLHHHPAAASPLNNATMGTSMPGFDVKILDENLNRVHEYGLRGMIAIDVDNSPLNFFGGYWKADHKTKERVVTHPSSATAFELTGDSGYRNEIEQITFEGRADDVINTSGFRVGPKELEDVLIEHEAVKESGVVGKPDELRGQVIVAFAVLLKGYQPSDQLKEDLQKHVKTRLGSHLAPKQIIFVDELPKTEAGKIRRNVLRQQL